MPSRSAAAGGGPFINLDAIEPLFKPWDLPNRHRVRAERAGDPAIIKTGRRPSPIAFAQNLRELVTQWRESSYAGASDTTRELFEHWFERDHRVKAPGGQEVPFRYYFCQREAIETFVYLYEVRGIRSLSALTAEYGGPDAERAALGIDPEEDIWPKYAFKVATGAGKTKIMSMAIVWSYFHALRESDSPMARHFVVIAPNLTVFERLKEDFGHGRIFDADPLIPTPWRGDWNLSVVLQDEASGAATGGVLYLTNIHRLYDTSSRKRNSEADYYDWMGPKVSKASALDTGEELRKRITSHPHVMVLNDEAHHVWDPDSAWNEAIRYLHDSVRQKTGNGLVAQLDFSATPKDDRGNVFKHIVCDTPLGEAVDAGIVKTPVIGQTANLTERTHDDAGYRYEQHLLLGYRRWLQSMEEWEKSGKKALLFVMTESTEAANGIAKRLNSDPLFAELNGKTINLHTNLKGKLKKRRAGGREWYEFIEDEKQISDQDLEELRKLSRELDDSSSPYRCIVSVLMLREGWDVRNVTTIVPLRPYTSKANILPEQTLGRGLRRMTFPGDTAEIVTIVEHPAFSRLYQEELRQEGLDILVTDVDKVPRTTVTIFPDRTKQNFDQLDLLIPRLTAQYRIVSKLENLTSDDVRDAFQKKGFKPLPLGGATAAELDWEGKHLITGEIVEQMKVSLPLLENGVGAISFFRDELERITSIRGTHPVLAPLIQQFIEEVLFEEKSSIFDARLVSRLADADVREHIRAVFVPLIRARTTKTEERLKLAEPISVCTWRPFQVTHSERHPSVPARTTPFNLVPCDRGLEVAMTEFADRAPDVAAFCKNAGPQCLRIDYLAAGGRLAFYTPDFIVRRQDGHYHLVETKGRADRDMAARARAAAEWCKSASTKKVKWDYLYVPQDIFARITRDTIDELARACAPALAELVEQAESPQLVLPFAEVAERERKEQVEEFISAADLERLPKRFRDQIEQAILLFRFLERKESATFGSVFQPLLGPVDELAEAIMVKRLEGDVPTVPADQRLYFEPDLSALDPREAKRLLDRGRQLKKLLVFRTPLMQVGLLIFCLEYAAKTKAPPPGVLASIVRNMATVDGQLLQRAQSMYDFRNTYVAHVNAQLTDAALARRSLKDWIEGVIELFAVAQ